MDGMKCVARKPAKVFYRRFVRNEDLHSFTTAHNKYKYFQRAPYTYTHRIRYSVAHLAMKRTYITNVYDIYKLTVIVERTLLTHMYIPRTHTTHTYRNGGVNSFEKISIKFYDQMKP